MTRAAWSGFTAFSQACRTNIVHQQTDETKAVWPGSTIFTGTEWYISMPVDETAARDQSNLVTGYSVLTSILTSISSKYNTLERLLTTSQIMTRQSGLDSQYSG